MPLGRTLIILDHTVDPPLNETGETLGKVPVIQHQLFSILPTEQRLPHPPGDRDQPERERADRFARAALTLVCALTGCAATPPPTALDQQPPELVSAFFGLDDSLPPQSIAICPEAPGKDGMPVTFSRRVVGSGIEGARVDAAAFTVVTRSGQQTTPVCASLRPAVGSSERHTVLLIGDFGDPVDDPPVQVAVTGHLPLDGGADGLGLAVDVTPLEAGPSIVLAMGHPAGGRDSDCPEGTRQVVEVVWSGGVVPGPGQTPESHREMYSVTTETGEAKPIALGGVADNDNYEQLCLDTESPASRVSAAEGILQDPRGDLNPPTSLAVAR